MDNDDRQIYRFRNGIRNQLAGGASQNIRKLSNQAKNKIRRGVEKSIRNEFGVEVNLDEVQKIASSIREMEEITRSKIKPPSFPIVLFGIALAVDIIGLADLSGFGWFVATAIELVFKGVLLVAMWNKVSSSFKFASRALFRAGSIPRKIFLKYFVKRLALLAFLDSIPLFGILASDAFFVYLSHNKHKVVVQQYMAFMESVGKFLEEFEKRSRDLL